LSADKTSAATGLIKIKDKTPYLVEPVNYFETSGKCKLTIQAVEQTAKSTSWKLGAIWRLRYMPSPTGIIYQNESVGQKIIKDSFLPMLRCEPEFAIQIPERANENPKTLNIKNAPTYLMTGEGAIISIPLGMIIGDEINKWRQEKANRSKRKFTENDDYQVSKLKDMDKRTRTYEDSIRVLVCSPEGKNAPITTEFYLSSMGYFYLRCVECGELSMNTTTPEEYFGYEAIDGTVNKKTIFLKCPRCGHIHSEEDKIELTRNGGYIHEHKERKKYHAGFCWGALAAQFPGVDWLEICQAIETAKNSNSYEAHAYLCNSIKGLPFTPQIITGEKLSVIRSHFRQDEISSEDFQAIYMAVDTQEVGYWFAIMAIDINDNWYTIDYGYAWDDETIINAWNTEYYGIQPMAGIIDEGGHRKPDVNFLLGKLGSGFYKYKGEGGNRKDNFRFSENDENLILAQAKRYNAEMLYLIYSQHETNNNYWSVCCKIERTFTKQMVSFQPPPDDKEADFEDWTPFDRQHDLFDAHKMALVIHDVAIKHFGAEFFLKLPQSQIIEDEHIKIKTN